MHLMMSSRCTFLDNMAVIIIVQPGRGMYDSLKGSKVVASSHPLVGGIEGDNYNYKVSILEPSYL
jgi:hypothetical protein